MNRSRWKCTDTKRHIHMISENEMNERLAETWGILLGLSGQPTFRQNHSLIDAVDYLSNQTGGTHNE